ncbi:uncharacterized protein LOC135338715 isoform X3 [Halichondria panicea]
MCKRGYKLKGPDHSHCNGKSSNATGRFRPYPPTCKLRRPSIFKQPEDEQFVEEGSSVKFRVKADGRNLIYQWFKDSEMIFDIDGVFSGTDSPVLYIENVTLAEVGRYAVNVSNDAGIDLSDIVTLLTTSSYMLNVSVNISEPTLEASEQSIEYVVSLGRIDGKRIRFIPRPLFVKLVSFGFPENVTEEGDDFDLGFHSFVFGPCRRRCIPPLLYKPGFISIRDDNDLEFDHEFYVGFDPEFVSLYGISLGEPEKIYIIDDEQLTVGVSFDQANYIIAEGNTLTVTGRLTRLTGQLKTNFFLTLKLDFDVDQVTNASEIMIFPDDLTINFLAGEDTNFTISLTVEDNNRFEGFHSFVISLPTDSDYIVPREDDNGNTTITISDFDDAVIQVSTMSLEGNEGTNLTDVICASLTVSSTNPILKDIEVSFELVAGIADASDYTAIGSLQTMFPVNSVPGSTPDACVTVSLIDDEILESTQEFSIILSSDNAQVSTDRIAVDIMDGEDITLRFTADEIIVKEGVDMYALFQLVMTNVPSGGLEGTIEYTVFVSPSGATLNQDYRSSRTVSLLFGTCGEITPQATLVGSLSTVGQVEIVNDEVLDSNSEDIGLFLLETGNFALLTIIILDDERATLVFESPSYTADEGSSVTLTLALRDIPADGLDDNVIVSLQTIDIGKTATGIDYAPPSFFQVTFLATTPSPTNMSQTFVIAILTDNVLEDLELFEVVVSDVNSLYVVCDSEADCTTQVVIEQEGSDLPSWNLLPATGTEGDTVAVCATLFGLPANGLECDFVLQLIISEETIPNTATEGEDFTPVGDFQIVFESTIPTMTTMRYAQINLTDDNTTEGDEIFFVTVSEVTPSFVLFASSNFTSVNIQDNDIVCDLSFVSTSYTVREDEGSVSVCVSISGVPSGGLAVDLVVEFSYLASDKTTSDVDFTPDYEVVFPAGLTGSGCIQCLDIAIMNDAMYEGDGQLFNVSFDENNLNVSFSGDSLATVYILEDASDVPAVSLNFDQLTVIEVEGVVSVCATISSVPAGGLNCPITLSLSATGTGDKPATDGEDYVLPGDFQIVFDTNVLSGDSECVNISITDDERVENEQEFVVMVTSISSQVELPGFTSVYITIEDDDTAVASFSPGGITVTESNFINATVCVELTSLPTGGLECDVDISLSPSSGSAALNEDYESFVLVITIPAGTSLSQPVCAYSVQLGIIDDQIVEDTQSFTLSLVTASPEGTVNSSGVLEINIMDDDYLFVDLQSSEYLLNEGKNVPVCVLFSSQLQRSVTVSSHYEDLTNLLRGEVRLGITGPLYLIGAGASSTNTVEPGMVCVSKNNKEDTVKEGTTLSVLRLNSSEMAVKIGCRQALFIETANDVVLAELVTLSPMVYENEGAVEICVQLDHLPVGSIVTVALTTQPLIATEDEDYLSLTATLEWHYDSPSVVQCVSVPIINDECVEEKEEVFTVSLSTEQACVQLGANLTTVTIQDDDVLVLDFRPVGVITESNGMVDTCIYVCDGQLKRNSSITVSFWNGTAQYPADFTRPLLSEEVVLTPNNTARWLCLLRMNVYCLRNHLLHWILWTMTVLTLPYPMSCMLYLRVMVLWRYA